MNTIEFLKWFIILWFIVGFINAVIVYVKYRNRGIELTFTEWTELILLGWFSIYFWITID